MGNKRILGIVAEYNPFHFGHEYQIEMARTLYKCDGVVAVMSGNYVQRGEPAIIDKYSRAETAVENGIDLVIELPMPYACQNAELFAYAGVRELKKLGVTAISFGCENDNIDQLKQIANLQINKAGEYRTILKEKMSAGLSYPQAVNEAVNSLLGLDNVNILSPNNILAIEYIKSAIKLSYEVEFVPVKRHKVEHNEMTIVDNFASATAIRAEVKAKRIAKIKKTLPKSSYEQLKYFYLTFKQFNDLDNFLDFIYYKILSLGKNGLRNIFDIVEGIENKIYENAGIHNNLNDFILSIKSKRYTYSRINRILLNILLGITYDEMIEISQNPTKYVKALAFNPVGQEILAQARDNDVPIITKFSDYKRNGIDTDNDLVFQLTKRSTDIYYLPFKHSNYLTEIEYKKNVILVK